MLSAVWEVYANHLTATLRLDMLAKKLTKTSSKIRDLPTSEGNFCHFPLTNTSEGGLTFPLACRGFTELSA